MRVRVAVLCLLLSVPVVSVGQDPSALRPLLPQTVAESPVRVMVPPIYAERHWLKLGQWQLQDFGDAVPLEAVRLTWQLPLGETARFRLDTSTDGVQWTGQLRSTFTETAAAGPPRDQWLPLAHPTARYLRIVGFWSHVPPVWRSLVAMQAYRGTGEGMAPRAPAALHVLPLTVED